MSVPRTRDDVHLRTMSEHRCSEEEAEVGGRLGRLVRLGRLGGRLRVRPGGTPDV